MSGMLSSDSQVIHDELEKAKETVSRLRCVNGVSRSFCRNTAVCPGCWRHEHDVTIGRCSGRDGAYSNRKDDLWESINQPYVIVDCDGYSNTSSMTPVRMPLHGDSSSRGKKGLPKTSSKKSSMPREKCVMSYTKSTMSRADLEQVHKQINSLEKDIRGPVLSYVKKIEQQNRDIADVVKSIQLQLSKYERDPPVGHRDTSEGFRISSDDLRKHSECAHKRSVFGDSKKDGLKLHQNASYQSEQANQFRAESLEKELSICQQKLEKAEEKVKELYRSLSQKQVIGGSVSSETSLESQLQRQQQLAESYLKESISKERELSFLTIEKYKLQNEVSSLLSDLESCNRKRNEMTQEQKKLQATLEANRKNVSDLQNELTTTRSENRRLKTRFRDELSKERAVSEQKSEILHANDKEIKELRKKVEAYEQNESDRKNVTHHLEREKSELLSKAPYMNSELKTRISDCSSLQEENNRLSKEITNNQQEETISNEDSEKTNAYGENFKSELQEGKSSVKGLEESLASEVDKSKYSSEIAKFNNKEIELRSQIENAEKDKIALVQELTELRKLEVDYTNELKGVEESFESSENDLKELNESCSALKNELEESHKKYLEVKKTNEELLSAKIDLEKSTDKSRSELVEVTAKYNDILVKHKGIASDLKAYKRIVAERDEQLRRIELEMNQLHKAKEKDLKELLQKDKEIAILKAGEASAERKTPGSLGPTRSLSQSNLSTLQYEPGQPSKETEVYLKKIVELENVCKEQKSQIEKYQKEELYSTKEVRKPDSLKQKLLDQDDKIQELKREISRSKQTIEDLKVKEEHLSTVETEREKLRRDVEKLQAKVEQAKQLKDDWAQREQEIKALQRTSSDETDFERKVSRLKDRCREKDDEIEELHKKVISLQTKIKDFVRQNSRAEEEVRQIKDNYATELNEKERISHALSNAETKYRDLKKEMENLRNNNEEWEKKVKEVKTKVESLESEKEESNEKLKELTAEEEKNREERNTLKRQVAELEEAARQHEEVLAASDIQTGASTPLDNSLESSRVCLSRNGRASALDRLETLEEENIQLLSKQRELEDELDAAEEHAQELKNALKSKRDNVNDLRAELDITRERVKSLEKSKAELSDENEELQQTCLLSKQKIEDLNVASERYMEESDVLEKALTTAEQRVEELEKRLEEVSSNFASSESQLQSMSERLSRKERELEIVENQVEEQRKLSDGYKTSAEQQETLIEKIRGEKNNAEKTLLAMKVEIAKKDITNKAGKEKVSEMQSRLYETEDKFSRTTKELKKLNRENERLKREIKDLELKVSELQMMLKKSKLLELENTTPVTGVYNTKFQTITTSVKGNALNMEGLDKKLNQAQTKISTLEVELANDLRKFSLQRTSPDAPRRSFSRNLSPGSYNLRRPQSYSNLSTNDGPLTPSISRPGSTPSINEDDNAGVKTRGTPEISIHQVDVEHTSEDESQALFLNLGDGADSDEQNRGSLRENLSEFDPFLSGQITNSSTEDLSSSEHFESRTDQNLTNEATSFFQDSSAESSREQEVATVQETVTSSAADETGNMTLLFSPSMHQGSNGEELIRF